MPFMLEMYDHYHTYLSVSVFSSLYLTFIVVFLSHSLKKYVFAANLYCCFCAVCSLSLTTAVKVHKK